VTDLNMAPGGSATVHVLHEGYVGRDGDDDLVVCTHAWWAAFGPPEDPLGADAGQLHASRDLLLRFATLIVPGHGAPFRPDQDTPR
jgi:hypothetical protein